MNKIMKQQIASKFACCGTIAMMLIMLSGLSFAQNKKLNFENFDKAVIDYYPSKRAYVTNSDYQNGKVYLENTYNTVKSKNSKFDYSDYWNIALGFLFMGERNKNVAIAFRKAATADHTKACEKIEQYYQSADFQRRKQNSAIPIALSAFSETCDNFSTNMSIRNDVYNVAGSPNFGVKIRYRIKYLDYISGS